MKRVRVSLPAPWGYRSIAGRRLVTPVTGEHNPVSPPFTPRRSVAVGSPVFIDGVAQPDEQLGPNEKA